MYIYAHTHTLLLLETSFNLVIFINCSKKQIYFLFEPVTL